MCPCVHVCAYEGQTLWSSPVALLPYSLRQGFWVKPRALWYGWFPWPACAGDPVFALCCVTKLFLGEVTHTHQLTSERDSHYRPSINTIKVQLVELMSLIGVTYRNIGHRCITKAYLAWVTVHKSWESGTHCTGWRMSFPSTSVDLTLFQAAQLVCFF